MKFEDFVNNYKLKNVKGVFIENSNSDYNINSFNDIERLKKSNLNLLNSGDFLELDDKLKDYKFSKEKLIEKYKDYYISSIKIIERMDENSESELEKYADALPKKDDEFFDAIMKLNKESLVMISKKTFESQNVDKKSISNIKFSSSINCYAVFDVVYLEFPGKSEDGYEYDCIYDLLGLFDSENDAYKFIKKRTDMETAMCEIKKGHVVAKTFREYYTNMDNIAVLNKF